MTTYTTYILVQFVPMIVCSIFFTGAMVVVGLFIIKPKATIKRMFPFVKKEDDEDDAYIYNFRLQNGYVGALFVIMHANIFIVNMIFWSSILVSRSTSYNPYGGPDCFYNGNHTLVTLTPDETLFLTEDVVCFSWSPDPMGALGNATGAFAFSWLIINVVTWIVLHLYKRAAETDGKCLKLFYYILLVSFQLCIYLTAVLVITLATVYRQYFSLIGFLQIIFFGFLLGGSGTTLWWLTDLP